MSVDKRDPKNQDKTSALKQLPAVADNGKPTALALLPASRNLYKLIFNSESPEHVIKTFPAQSVYMAIKQGGLQSSAEIISAASLEQCRLIFDFDVWEKDRFREEAFWEWLSLPDSTEDLSILQKLLKFVDLKLIALMIDRYTNIIIMDDATDQPPAAGYYTPDSGYTWILVTAEDADQSFLMGRLLALIFETSHELFYQLISIPGVATQSVLEEDSYQDQKKRLSSEGIPDFDYAQSVHRSLSKDRAQLHLKKKQPARAIEDIQAVTPFVYDTLTVRPLATVLQSLKSMEGFQCEFTLLMNTAIVRWSVPFYETDKVAELISMVKGLLNIGLEVGAELSGDSPEDIASLLSWQQIYQLGLGEVEQLGERAKQLRKLNDVHYTTINEAVLECLSNQPANMPAFFRDDGSFNEVDGKLESGIKPIEYLKEVKALDSYLSSL